MKHGALFINTSRGELLDEEALLYFLKNNKLAGAALDVLHNEHQLEEHSTGLVYYAQKHNNLIITPHIGGCTYESMEKTEIFMATKLASQLARDKVKS